MKEIFDFDEHEKQLAERYRQLARFESFDKLVDMALDGVITMAQAQTAWLEEESDYGTTATN
jgi:hypothetical protein